MFFQIFVRQDAKLVFQLWKKFQLWEQINSTYWKFKKTINFLIKTEQITFTLFFRTEFFSANLVQLILSQLTKHLKPRPVISYTSIDTFPSFEGSSVFVQWSDQQPIQTAHSWVIIIIE